MIIKIRDQY